MESMISTVVTSHARRKRPAHLPVLAPLLPALFVVCSGLNPIHFRGHIDEAAVDTEGLPIEGDLRSLGE